MPCLTSPELIDVYTNQEFRAIRSSSSSFLPTPLLLKNAHHVRKQPINPKLRDENSCRVTSPEVSFHRATRGEKEDKTCLLNVTPAEKEKGNRESSDDPAVALLYVQSSHVRRRILSPPPHLVIHSTLPLNFQRKENLLLASHSLARSPCCTWKSSRENCAFEKHRNWWDQEASTQVSHV